MRVPVIQFEGQTFVGEPLAEGLLGWHEAGGAALVVMPAVSEAWPAEVQGAYCGRVVANLTQRCPACLSDELDIQPVAPTHARAALAHRRGCQVGDDGPLAEYVAGGGRR